MSFNTVIGWAALCGVAGYLLGVVVACYWHWPRSNLCGIVGVITGPIDFVAGGVCGWIYSRPRADEPAAAEMWQEIDAEPLDRRAGPPLPRR